MAETTKIAWADSTFNFWIGCEKVSPACTHCYAADMAHRYGWAKWGSAAAGGTRTVTAFMNWRKLRYWNKQAAKAGVRRRVFVNSLSDFFEAWPGLFQFQDGSPAALCAGCFMPRNANHDEKCPWCRAFLGIMAAGMPDIREAAWRLIDECRNLDFLLLTKRPENARRMIRGRARCASWPDCTHPDCEADHAYPNVWLGTTVENQEQAARIDKLLECRSLFPVLFLSMEPLLERTDIALRNWHDPHGQMRLDWVIVGGESGPGARLMDPKWVKLIIEDCELAGVPFFMKQMTALAPIPADLLIRQFPEIGAQQCP